MSYQSSKAYDALRELSLFHLNFYCSLVALLLDDGNHTVLPKLLRSLLHIHTCPPSPFYPLDHNTVLCCPFNYHSLWAVEQSAHVGLFILCPNRVDTSIHNAKRSMHVKYIAV